MIDDILYLLRLRLRFLVLPVICLPLCSVFFLLQVEPKFVSTAKIWAKERNEGSNLLKIQREGLQEETHVKIQTEILFSDRVIHRVIESNHLDTPPPSQSIWARWVGGQVIPKEEDHERALRYAIKAFKSSLHVDLLNPETLLIQLSMNEPRLAQKLLTSLLYHYREVYREILQDEVEEYASFLSREIAKFGLELEEKALALIDFERQHALIPQESSASFDPRVPALMGKEVGDVSPFPIIMSRISELELEQNRLLTFASAGNKELIRIGVEINKDKDLLNSYNEKLRDHAEVLVRHQELQWELSEVRQRHQQVQSEYDKVILSKGTKLDESIGITILDEPNFDPEKIAPKKKVALAASLFMGCVLGLSAVYLLSLLEPTYRRAKDLEKETSVPVLAHIKEEV